MHRVNKFVDIKFSAHGACLEYPSSGTLKVINFGPIEQD
jgi:hypothetical protein